MDRICNIEECTGCAACYNICHHSAILMREDKEGFLFPTINPELCVDCGLCQTVCPNVNLVSKWSDPDVYAAWSNDDSIRQSSSSGGMFFSIAQKIIQEGGVVFGAIWGETVGVVHSYTETIEGLKAMQGSKYLQSEIGDSYKNALQFLKDGRKVLFTGTPCQIAGLRGFLGKRGFDNLLTVDIICHGTPSKMAFRSYFEKLRKKIGDADYKTYSFRNLCGWGYKNTVGIKGNAHELWGEESLYFKLFIDSYLHRESCYSCQYTCKERVSDITIADFWGIGKEIPFINDTSKGCSLVLVNTPKGKDFLISISPILYLEHRTVEEAMADNMHLSRPSVRPQKRDISYSILQKHSLTRTYYEFYSTRWRYYCHMIKRFGKSIIKSKLNKSMRPVL